MAKRRLRIVKRTPSILGVCERRSVEFTGSEAEIRAAFDGHDCVPPDSSQNALRDLREVTESM